MAAYPAYAWLLTSATDGDGGIVLDKAQDGTTRARTFFPDTKRTFDGRHILTAADCAALLVFYEDNKALAVTITWTGPDPGTYDCLFAARPKFTPLAPNAFDVLVKLVEQ